MILCKNFEDILKKRNRATYYLQVNGMAGFDEFVNNMIQAKEVFDWLDKCGILYEVVGFPGMLIGDFGFRFIDFDGEHDPNLKKYVERFEDKLGSSINPAYQLYVVDPSE